MILKLNKNTICDVILLEMSNNHLLNWELSNFICIINLICDVGQHKLIHNRRTNCWENNYYLERIKLLQR